MAMLGKVRIKGVKYVHPDCTECGETIKNRSLPEDVVEKGVYKVWCEKCSQALLGDHNG